jgi:hypothetical protein
MSNSVLQTFLKEEANEYVRKQLLRSISDCLEGTMKVMRTFDFNIYTVTIDCESKTVTIEDELTADSSGEQRVDIEDFAKALWSEP